MKNNSSIQFNYLHKSRGSFLLFCISILFLVSSCAKKVVPAAEKKNDNNIAYSEDLTEFRNLIAPDSEISGIQTGSKKQPVITTEPLYENDKLDLVLNEKAAKNKNIKYANGYRIQLYVGRERQIVDNAKIYVYQNYPNLNPYLSFSLPIYKLKVGDFLSKSDAERVFAQLKDQFPDAMIISDKIDVKKSFLKE
jgi:SPOR domain